MRTNASGGLGRRGPLIFLSSLPSLRSLQWWAKRPLLLSGVLLSAGVLLACLGVLAPLANSLLLVALAVFAASAFQDPTRGLLGAIAVLYLLPFAVSPVAFGPFHPSFLDFALTVALAAWLLRRAMDPRHTRVTPVGLIMLLFLGIASMALLNGIATLSPERFRLFLKMVNSMLLFFTVINCLTNMDLVTRTVRATLCIAGLSAFIGACFFVLPAGISAQALGSLDALGYPPPPGALRYIAETTIQRAVGTAIDPNLLGGMLASVIPLALTQLLSTQPLLPRRYVALITLGLVWVLLLTYSRAAWGGAFVGVVFLALMRHRVLWVPVAALVLLLALLPQRGLFLERFWGGATFADRAAQMRLGEYQDAMRLIGRYPLLGVGFGAAPDRDLYVGASSGYLLLAEQTGLVGLGAFLATIGVFFCTTWQQWHRRRYPWQGEITLGAWAGVVCTLAAALFDHYFVNLQFPHTVALLWLLVGLTLAAARVEL